MKITKSNLSYTNYFKLLENLTKSRREEKKKTIYGKENISNYYYYWASTRCGSYLLFWAILENGLFEELYNVSKHNI